MGDSGNRTAAEEEMRRARERLKGFKKRFDGDWMVPRIEILEL